MHKSIMFVLACCLALGAIAVGQTKRIILKDAKDARVLEGTVTETATEYQVETKFGAVRVPKDQVASIVDVVTPAQEYSQRLAAIDPASPSDHYGLGKWAFDKDLLSIAHKELTEALRLKKDYEKAELLLRQVIRKQQAAQDEPDSDEGQTKPDRPRPGMSNLDTQWLLTAEEISRIRLAELSPTDRVRVRFENDLLSRFITAAQGYGDFESPRFADTFRGWPRIRQARYIIDDYDDRNDHGFRDDIVVESDPRFMIEYRRGVWPIVARHYATAELSRRRRAVGGLRLFNIRGRANDVDYTNFLILDSYERHGRKLINRDHEDLSLLLQFGLPQDQAQYPHPGKILSPFRSRTFTSYRRVMGWIESLNGPPHPFYGVTLRVPWAVKERPPATTQPAATQPAEQKAAD